MSHVSVIIPAYNAAATLCAAIESALSQEPAPLEVIVVDDGSTDDTAAVAAAYPCHVITQQNAGPSAARNRGVSQASGDYFAFLDADDRFLPGKIAAQLEALSAHPEVGFCYTSFLTDSGDSISRPCPLLSSILIRREAFWRIGPLDESLRNSEDVDWLMRAADEGVTPVHVDQDFVIKAERPDSLSHAPEARSALFKVMAKALARRRAKSGESRSLGGSSQGDASHG